MKIEDAKRGMEVLYMPHHAEGDVTHPDCEKGIVSSTNGKTIIFVCFRGIACSPEDLISL